jgi:2-dehydro-3-deoxy-D-arabinonate dehydratase
MKLGQIHLEGSTVAAIFEAGQARPIPGYTTAELIHRAETESVALPALIPIHPVEVWACGCTYETSAAFRDAEHGTREGMYAHVYQSARPEIFFKGAARVCVGPGQPIGLRADSKFTAPEPELALILGSRGAILGFTLANDVSAWDIERENALYLPQSKVYSACCALGPVIVTADELADPYQLEMTCTITRNGVPIFQGETSTARLHRKFEILVDYLLRSNPVPAASVLLTGTGIIVTEEAALGPGDRVSIRIPEIGELSNPAVIVE